MRLVLFRLGLLLFAQILAASAQSSFAAMKFDLSPNLPVEDLTVAGFSHDEKQINFTKTKDNTKTPKVPKKTTPVPTTIAVTSNQILEEDFKSKDANNQETQARIVPHVRTMTITEETMATTAAKNFESLTNLAAPLLKIAQPLQKHVEQHPYNSGLLTTQLRADEWFQENFDTKNCTQDGDDVAQAFKRKFPRNLLRDGKEALLAELLATRIYECRNKHDRQHWNRVVDALVAQSTNTPAIEREECVSGLIEEQIACMNVISYSCQFIRPSYEFLLLPTRIIVQEARYAEDGADKCRKFVRKMSRVSASTTPVSLA